MAAILRMQLNTKDLERGIAKLQERAPFALARAVNRAAESARTAMVRAMATDMGMSLKASTIRDQIVMQPAHPRHLVASLVVTGRRIPLIDFKARGPEPSRGRGRGVTAGVRGGRTLYPRAFIATMSSGHRGVFLRKGTARLPIAELHGPSLPHVFAKYFAVGQARGEEALITNVQHELRFALSQAS